MKGSSHPANDLVVNPSTHESIRDVIDRVEPSRRRFLQSSLGAATLSAAGGLTLAGLSGTVEAVTPSQGAGLPGIGFAPVPASLAPVADRVSVPTGYTAELFVAWGDPIMKGALPFSGSASETAAEQARQFGAHTDGMHFFPFPKGHDEEDDHRDGKRWQRDPWQALSSRRGLLVTNHEYTHEEILYPDGQIGASGYTIAKTRKSQAAHGGWVVEIDPFDPDSTPIKRTALGRFKHEGAWVVVDDRNRVAVYMGDDERNEYVYKFVCARKYNSRNQKANRDLLDDGILYVARFNADLTGTWIPLLPGTLGTDGVALRDNPNFAGADDAEVLAKILIKTRMAGDAVGATMMDRPEWTGVRPRVDGFKEIEAYCTLTNNNRRGGTPVSANLADGSTAAGSARPAVDAANPRANNLYGGVLRWREAGRSVRATSFTWDLFIQNGDTRTTKTALPSNDFRGSIVDTSSARTTAASSNTAAMPWPPPMHIVTSA
jgi:secreted PhoX family phosphatase